jgi:acetylornithine deacetylase/succinyl-diaminopimelate desuccinylase family protein
VADISPVVRLLRELIAIPSVNPAFLSENDPRSGELRMAEFLAATAGQAGLVVDLHPVEPERPNVLARLMPSGPIRSRVVLAPHLDTVGEPNLAKLLRPRLESGRVYGRGACDTKGCVAAMLQAVMNVAKQGVRPRETEIVFAGLVDEEHAQIGSRHFARRGPGAALAIVGEPTRLDVVTAHKGDVWFQLKTQGKSAHGATPHHGVNAIHLAAKLVDALETRYAQQLKKRGHPLLGSPTVNVGVIQGGRQPNIVPAECTIEIDRRTLPGEDQDSVKREIQEWLREVGIKAEFTSLRAAVCDPMETDSNLPLVQLLMKAARRKETLGVHYFCDAAPLAAGGIPSVVFGPGDIAQAHTSDEYIAVSQLERAVVVLERFLRQLP